MKTNYIFAGYKAQTESIDGKLLSKFTEKVPADLIDSLNILLDANVRIEFDTLTGYYPTKEDKFFALSKALGGDYEVPDDLYDFDPDVIY